MSSQLPRIVCIAVLSKTNAPLHLTTFPPTLPPLQYHFLLHTTLDIFSTRAPSKTADNYFGLLYNIDEELSAYGWMTNTGVKFVVVVEGGGVEEASLKGVMRDIHTAWIAVVMNPFYREGGGVGRRFEERVKALAEGWRGGEREEEAGR